MSAGRSAEFDHHHGVGRRIEDIGTLVDQAHAFFGEVEALLPSQFDDEVLQRAELVVHEWVANLVQYASFSNRQPVVILRVRPDGRRVRFEIEDNSEGFDLRGQLRVQRHDIKTLPERGMGLLIIQACTEELTYRRTGAQRHSLIFYMDPEEEAYVDLPL